MHYREELWMTTVVKVKMSWSYSSSPSHRPFEFLGRHTTKFVTHGQYDARPAVPCPAAATFWPVPSFCQRHIYVSSLCKP